MIWLVPGIVSFACFLLFDIEKAAGKRYAPALFFAGVLLLAISTVELFLAHTFETREIWRTICGVTAVIWFITLLYVLFGALPAKKVYSGDKRLQTCSSGVYALCRHPSGWCFLFLYWFLWLYAPSIQLLYTAIVFPAINFLYIWVQDCYLFPKYIEGYDSYKQTVPFLFPTRYSLRKFLSR